MRIGQLAQLVGVETQTIRFYEQQGLLPPPDRQDNGYRVYTALILELKGFYRNFGLTMDARGNELEDTLTAELEFMHFLTAKQAQAELEGLPPNAYQRAQRDFLERHLVVWLPLVREEVKAKVATQFFVALTELAEQFVTAHLQHVCCGKLIHRFS